MLKETKYIKQHPGERFRRWFEDEYFDLIVWYDSGNKISDFQLCYNKVKDEHVLSWQAEAGFSHNRIDDGEGVPLKNLTPILVPDGAFPFNFILERFKERAGKIDPKITEFIVSKINEYNEQIPG